VIAMPHLQFRVYNRRQQKQYLLMMSSDYERSDWRDAIAGLMNKGRPQNATQFLSVDKHLMQHLPLLRMHT